MRHFSCSRPGNSDRLSVLWQFACLRASVTTGGTARPTLRTIRGAHWDRRPHRPSRSSTSPFPWRRGSDRARHGGVRRTLRYDNHASAHCGCHVARPRPCGFRCSHPAIKLFVETPEGVPPFGLCNGPARRLVRRSSKSEGGSRCLCKQIARCCGFADGGAVVFHFGDIPLPLSPWRQRRKRNDAEAARSIRRCLARRTGIRRIRRNDRGDFPLARIPAANDWLRALVTTLHTRILPRLWRC